MSSSARFLPVLPVLLLLAGAGALGCGGEERYCDATGCYYCDGLGCRPVDDDPDPAGDAGSVPTTCTTDEDCGADARCSAGECRAEDELCQFNHECGAGRLCIDGRCGDECATAEDCSDGQVCEAGACICDSPDGCSVDDHPEPFCQADDECQPGHPCEGGICRTPCDTHEDCQRFDVQFNYCLDGYCATTNEVTSNCALTIDCPTGKTCLDGICR
ncbi:MAG: hypothetical protein ACOCXM_03875 [Myxococcota bacterium]